MTYHFKDNPYIEWMSNLPETLTSLPLNFIAIPGSHDSFTYCLSSSSSVAPDAEDVIKKLTSIFGILAKSIVARWGKTQGLNTSGQLAAGIRYFDVRVAKNSKEKDEIYSCHSLFANPIKTDLTSINDFLNKHDKEVVLLDINHFYSFDMNEHFRLLRHLESIFGNKLVPYTYQTPSLDQLWKTPHRVFVFYHSRDVQRPYLWPGYFIPSPWANTNDLNKLLNYLTENYKQGRPDDYFYVSQGILTPTTGDIIKHVFSSLKSVMADKATPAFIKWLDDKSTGKGKINCTIVDFVEHVDYVSSVMQLNMKFAGDIAGLLQAHSLKN